MQNWHVQNTILNPNKPEVTLLCVDVIHNVASVCPAILDIHVKFVVLGLKPAYDHQILIPVFFPLHNKPRFVCFQLYQCTAQRMFYLYPRRL